MYVIQETVLEFINETMKKIPTFMPVTNAGNVFPATAG